MFQTRTGKPFLDHRERPPITIYIIDDDSQVMEKVSCWYCTRTVADIKGTIDKVITSPMPVMDFGIAVNIMCKQCHQLYRMVANSQIVQG